MGKRAILIDVEKQELREVTIAGLKDIQSAVGGQIELALTFGRNHMYVNEEGLFIFHKGFYFFGTPYMGNGLILGANIGTGEELSTDVKIENIKESVIFFKDIGI